MSDAGLFANERVELLDGTIVTMSAQSSPHAGTAHRLHRALARAFGETVCIRMQLPIVLDDWSEPEPDVAVCAPDPHDYTREHPHAAEVPLVCEVAVSSLRYDQSDKAVAYAASGISEYWIVDVDARIIHVLANPDPVTSRYRREQHFTEDGTIHAPGGTSLAVADILPPR